MDWIKEFKKSVEYARWHIADSAIFAYNTNIDAVKYLKGKDVVRIKLPFNSLIKKCMQRGEQKEIQISKRELNFLMNKLEYDSLKIGGQAGNMANAASFLGVDCFVHTNNKSKDQLSLFEKPENTLIAYNSDFKSPKEIDGSGDAVVHYVIEFKKGDKIDGKEIPASNRFIASFNPQNSEMEIDDAFKQNILKKIIMIDKVLISGFHNLTEKSGYETKIKKIEAQLLEWKILNPDLKIHLEFGEFQSNSVLKFVLREILPICNSAGFNESELDGVIESSKMRFGNIIEACEWVCAITGRAIFHCKDYSFALSKGREGKLYQLLFASLLAAYKAASGEHATFRDLSNFVHSGVRINKNGLREVENLSKIKTKFNIHFAPALLVEEPKSTVGIGDCFTAGYFLVD